MREVRATNGRKPATEPITGKPFPFNLEAERLALGAVIYNNEAMSTLNEHLESSDFFSGGNREIYLAMCAFHDGGSHIDIVTVSQYLSARGLLEKVGGAGYIASLTDGVPVWSDESLRESCKIVKQHSQRRQIINACTKLITSSFEAIETPQAAAEVATQEIYRVVEPDSAGELKSVAKIVSETPDILHRMSHGAPDEGRVMTGFTDLDGLVHGMGPAELIILAARPSLGKTALAIQIAINAARSTNLPVAFFSLEMNRESILGRMVTSEGRIDSHKVRTGNLSHQETVRCFRTLAEVSNLKVHIDDTSSPTVSRIRARASKLARKHGLCLAIVDYLQLMSTTRRFENRTNQVTYISQGLKGMAKDLGVPVIALSQLSRAGEGKQRRSPVLSDLRDSGSLEQEADVVLFLHYDKPKNEMTEMPAVSLIVGKQRNGPVGEVKLAFLREYTRFENYYNETKYEYD